MPGSRPRRCCGASQPAAAAGLAAAWVRWCAATSGGAGGAAARGARARARALDLTTQSLPPPLQVARKTAADCVAQPGPTTATAAAAAAAGLTGKRATSSSSSGADASGSAAANNKLPGALAAANHILDDVHPSLIPLVIAKSTMRKGKGGRQPAAGAGGCWRRRPRACTLLAGWGRRGWGAAHSTRASRAAPWLVNAGASTPAACRPTPGPGSGPQEGQEDPGQQVGHRHWPPAPPRRAHAHARQPPPPPCAARPALAEWNRALCRRMSAAAERRPKARPQPRPALPCPWPCAPPGR